MELAELVKNEEADLQTGSFGTQLKANEYVAEGIPVINVKNIGNGKVRKEKLEFIDNQKAAQLSVHFLRKGDIVFGRKGAVDRHALIDENSDEWFVRMRFPGYEKAKFDKSMPVGWEMVEIQKAFKITGGGTPSKKKRKLLGKWKCKLVYPFRYDFIKRSVFKVFKETMQ